MYIHMNIYIYIYIYIYIKKIEFPAKLLDYFLRSKKSNINQIYLTNILDYIVKYT